MNAVEDADGPTTRGPAWRRQRDTVNGSANASVASDWERSRHQGDFTPKFEFGDEIIKMDVRADRKWTDRDGHTSQGAQNQPLDPLTRNVPPAGETDDLEGPICSQNGYLCRNDLETCKNRCQRTVKEGKGQLNANGTEDLPCPVETDSNKSCNVDYSNAKAAAESCDPALTATVQCSAITKGLAAHASDHRDLWSTAISNKICVCSPANVFREINNPWICNANEADDQSTRSISNSTAY